MTNEPASGFRPDDAAPVWALDVGLAKTRAARAVGGIPMAAGLLQGGRDAQWKGFLALLSQHGQPATAVVGLPLKLDDSANPQQGRVNWWVRRLNHLGIATVMLNERFSSQQARRMMNEAPGLSTASEDELAAVVLLREYLEKS